MNIVRIAGSTEEKLEEAKKSILDRSLLFEDTNKVLYIKDKNDLYPLGGSTKQDKFEAGDNLEFIDDEEKGLTLRVVDDVVVDSLTTRSDGNGLPWKSQDFLGNIIRNHRIIVLCKQTKNTEPSIIGGEIVEIGENLKSHYQISLVSTGSFYIQGSTNESKDMSFVTLSYKDEIYYGIKFNNYIDSKVYFTGYKQINDFDLDTSTILDTDYEILSEYYPNYVPGTLETDLLYVYSTDKKTRSRISSKGVRLEKYNTTTKTWDFLGLFETDVNGNLIVTNDEQQSKTSITSQMPKNSKIYHLDEDLLDQNKENSKNITTEDTGYFISDEYIYLQNSLVYKGSLTIPKTTDDFLFFTKSDIDSDEGYLSTETGSIVNRISLAKKFNKNKSTEWGFTEDQLSTVIAIDAGN